MLDTRAIQDRRSVRFETLQDIVADVEHLEAVPAIRAAGNWTAAQNVEHIADGIDRSIDGYGLRTADDVRARSIARRDELLESGIPAGIRLHGQLARLLPAASVTWEAAIAHLRRAVARTDTERMSADHPSLGEMTHEQWTGFHCRHAELHLGFLHPTPAG